MNRRKDEHIMSRCIAVNCVDGRAQLPVIEFIKREYGWSLFDVITEWNPAYVLSERNTSIEANSIMEKIESLIKNNIYNTIVITAHHGCADNCESDADYSRHLNLSVRYVGKHFPELKVIGLWIDADGNTKEVCSAKPEENNKPKEIN